MLMMILSYQIIMEAKKMVEKRKSSVRSSVGSYAEAQMQDDFSETIMKWCFVAIIIALTIKAWAWVLG